MAAGLFTFVDLSQIAFIIANNLFVMNQQGIPDTYMQKTMWWLH